MPSRLRKYRARAVALFIFRRLCFCCFSSVVGKAIWFSFSFFARVVFCGCFRFPFLVQFAFLAGPWPVYSFKKSAENVLNLDSIWTLLPPPKKNRPCGAEPLFPAGAGPRTPICAIFATDSGWNLRGKPCSCDLIRS